MDLWKSFSFTFFFGHENNIERKVSLIKSYNKNYTVINIKDEKKENLIRIIIIAFKHEMKTLYSFKNVKKTILYEITETIKWG